MFLLSAAAGGYYAYEHGLRLNSLPWWNADNARTCRGDAGAASGPREHAEAIEVPLIRNFTVVVTNIAAGHTPSGHLQTLRPASAFTAVDRGGRIEIDPRSYDRYAGIAAAVSSIEPAGAARLYATLRPRIEEAHRESRT